MDRLIKRFDFETEDDLAISERAGVAYQVDMGAGRIAYDGDYFANYAALGGSPVELALNSGRLGLVARHLPAGKRLLDVGIGNGSFVRAAASAGVDAMGYDINPVAVEWLKAESLYSDAFREFDAITLWDSIEHIDAPEVVLKRVQRGGLVFAAIPVFRDLRRVRESKHYKPGEHLYYWTADGFVRWMAMHGFRLLERSDHETEAGRESIAAFAFVRDLPDYDDHIEAYREMHNTRFYGSSATELHLGRAAGVVRELNPRSILDYGCGRSDLVAHFWRDGARRIARYDPAIRQYRRMPEEAFDLTFCCDVMEHIPIASVDRVLAEVRSKSSTAFFTISLKLARAKLPDGRNAHVTLLTAGEWTRWVASYFGRARALKSHHADELVLLAGGAA